jgi:hypothetical protein
MGEIDRVNPLIRPVLGPRPADRVQPGSDRGRHSNEQPHDELELHTHDEGEELETQEDPDSPQEEIAEPEHGLDLSI